MNSIVYVGMDVHKEQYTLCCYSYDTDKVEYKQTIPSDYKLVLKYMELRPFTLTRDSFPKIVVRKDIGKRWYDDNGILNINVVDFLLDKELI